jgi:hypothetical protein
MLLACCDDQKRAQLSKKLNYLLTKLGQERRDVSPAIEQAYLRKLAQRFEPDR